MYFRDSNPSKIGLGYLESSLHEYSKTKHEYPAFKKEKTTGEFSQSSILLYPPPGKILLDLNHYSIYQYFFLIDMMVL